MLHNNILTENTFFITTVSATGGRFLVGISSITMETLFASLFLKMPLKMTDKWRESDAADTDIMAVAPPVKVFSCLTTGDNKAEKTSVSTPL